MTSTVLHELLSGPEVLGTPVEPDEPFVLESLALTWLVHLLEERFGLDADPDDSRMSGTTNEAAMWEYLSGLQPVGVVDDR